MNILYIQDQEILCYKGEYYHSKSEHFFERYLEGLEESDKLTVLCGIIYIEDEEKILKCKKVSHPRILYQRLPEFRKPGNIFSIYSKVKKLVNNADFCYLRSGIAASIAGYFCKKREIPYMAILNEDVFKNLWLHPNKILKIFAFPLYWTTRKMVKNANSACYVTQTYLQKQYPCKGEVIGCSDIEYLEYNIEYLESRLRKINNITHPIVLGSVGSVVAKLKGQDTVIKTLSYLKGLGIQCFKYELVGSGDTCRLKQLADTLGVSDMVIFRGPKSHEDVLKWFEGIDIYVHPSHSEGLPRTVIEAMSKATPCICTNVGGVSELINEKFLFNYNGHEIIDLAELLIALDSHVMKEQAIMNYEHAKDYDSVKLGMRRSLFFSKIISQARK